MHRLLALGAHPLRLAPISVDITDILAGLFHLFLCLLLIQTDYPCTLPTTYAQRGENICVLLESCTIFYN